MTGRTVSPLLLAYMLLFSVGGFCPIGAQEIAGPAPATILEFTDSFEQAVRGYDVDGWAQLVAPNVVMMLPNGRIVEGRDAFHDLWSRTFEGRTGANPLHLVVQEAEVRSDMAAVRLDYGPDGADPVGQYVWILAPGDEGEWHLKWWIFNRAG